MVDVKKAVEAIFADAVELRRDFHKFPELGTFETRTSGIVAEKLRSWGIEVQENVGGYGVIGLLKGANPGKCIAFRADMDALPIEEETGLEFKSQKEGVMHACGHDGHVAILLSAAKLLSDMKDQLSGSVKFLFQPSEEHAPDGGSRGMIRDGALENPKVDTVIALHIVPDVPLGKITISEGPASAAADLLSVEVIGKGGHGAQPHTAKDATVAGCEMVSLLQNVVSRWTNPLDMAVISIGTFNSGSAPNVINGNAKFQGSVRSLTQETREILKEGITTVIEGVAKATGTTAKIDYILGYDAVTNTPDATALVYNACNEYLDSGLAEYVKVPLSGSEDFSYFVQTCGSGAFVLLGASIEGAPMYSLHNPKFNWDERAMKNGIGMFVSTALKYLS